MPITEEGKRTQANRRAERAENARNLAKSADPGPPAPGKRVECRFDCDSVTLNRYGYEDVRFIPVYDPTGVNGNFAQNTPSGELRISVSNPEIVGVFQPGQRYQLLLNPLPTPEPTAPPED